VGTFAITSALGAPREVVWRHATTPIGINSELWPWLKMTVPRGLEDDISIDSVELGTKLGRSWILLFGVVPVDYDDLRLEELQQSRRFLERSKTSTMRVWQHERTITDRGAGCIVEDRLAFAPRRFLTLLPGIETISAAIVAAIFRHRHRRLQKLFGT
jgi:ligand-binding SRPBCC domain-containing protein